MLRVGLTGGIGSGKSTVAGIFGVLGIPVANADQAARAIMNEDSELRRQIIRHFGKEAYLPADPAHPVDIINPAHADSAMDPAHPAGAADPAHPASVPDSTDSADPAGPLNRRFLATQVFNNPEKLALLNSLVHPATLRAGEAWMARQSAHAPYAIREAALIFESNATQQLDFIIGVYAPMTLRIHRTMQRDKITREEVLQRLKNQIDETIKMQLCDAVIVNDDQQAVLPQVLALHARLLELAGRQQQANS